MRKNKIHWDKYLEDEDVSEKTICGIKMPDDPDDYNYTSDWDKVTCKRCLKKHWDFLQKFQKIYLMFDNDTAGQENIFEIVKRLGMWRGITRKLRYIKKAQKSSDSVKQELLKEI